MNYIVVFVCILTVLSVNASFGFDHIDDIKTVLAPFYFGYVRKHDTFSARLYFYNWSTAVNYSLMFHYQGPGNGSYTERVLIEENKTFLPFYKQMLYERISLHLISETEAGWCKDMTIIEGMAIDLFQSGSVYKYDSSCSTSSPCKIRVHLKNECTVSGAKTSITLIVLSSLFSIMFMVLVIIAFWIYCWNKPNPQGLLGVQTNDTQPFYLNMLFRRECNEEIAEIEAHHYEEIGPPVVEKT